MLSTLFVTSKDTVDRKFVPKILPPGEEIPKYQTKKKERKKREAQRGSRILIILNVILTNNNISSLAYYVPGALFDLIYILYTLIL